MFPSFFCRHSQIIILICSTRRPSIIRHSPEQDEILSVLLLMCPASTHYRCPDLLAEHAAGNPGRGGLTAYHRQFWSDAVVMHSLHLITAIDDVCLRFHSCDIESSNPSLERQGQLEDEF